MTDTTGDAPDQTLDVPVPDLPATEVPTRVLVLGMAHHDGTIHAGELYPVAEACGQSADQVRSCLRRLVTEGLFVRRGEGRDAVFEATAAGVRALGSTMERARLAYHQDAEGRGWDRTWRLVGFAIPEAKRSSRDAFRDRLLALGGAPIQNGLYVSPHRWAPDVMAEADRLDVTDHVTVASTDDLSVGGVRDPRELASRLWPLADVADSYHQFCVQYQSVPGLLDRMRKDHRRLTEAEFLPGSLMMAIRFEGCFRADPLLPPELLPGPGRGARRELLAKSRRLGILLREEHNRPRLFAGIDAILGDF